jgi:predicted metal-dependent enzyme (double-stranded beta helix superfamily)
VKGSPNKIEAAGAKALCEKDAEPLGTDIIHSVINPIDKLTGAIHIYGGDFFAAERSEWDSMTLGRSARPMVSAFEGKADIGRRRDVLIIRGRDRDAL